MDIYIGYESAYEYWMTPGSPRGMTLPMRSPSPIAGECPKAREVRDLLAANPLLSQLSPPVQIVTHVADRLKSSDGIIRHTQVIAISDGYAQIAPGVYMATPELCLVQLASNLGLPELLLRAYALCGTATKNRITDKLEDAVPATSQARLCWFTNGLNLRGAHGVARAQLAAMLVQNRAASPMEALTAMALTLPRRLGGLELEPAILNRRLWVPSHLRSLTRQDSYIPDLLWPGYNVVLEYDSDLEHANVEGLNHDSEKRNALKLMGYKVHSLTKQQLKDPNSLYSVYFSLCQDMGRQAQEVTATQRLALCDLLDTNATW